MAEWFHSKNAQTQLANIPNEDCRLGDGNHPGRVSTTKHSEVKNRAGAAAAAAAASFYLSASKTNTSSRYNIHRPNAGTAVAAVPGRSKHTKSNGEYVAFTLLSDASQNFSRRYLGQDMLYACSLSKDCSWSWTFADLITASIDEHYDYFNCVFDNCTFDYVRSLSLLCQCLKVRTCIVSDSTKTEVCAGPIFVDRSSPVFHFPTLPGR